MPTLSHTHSYSQKSSLLNTGHKSSQHTKVLRKFVQQIFSFKLPFLRFLHSSGLLCNCFYLFFVCFGFCFSLCNTFQCAFTVFALSRQYYLKFLQLFLKIYPDFFNLYYVLFEIDMTFKFKEFYQFETFSILWLGSNQLNEKPYALPIYKFSILTYFRFVAPFLNCISFIFPLFQSHSQRAK